MSGISTDKEIKSLFQGFQRTNVSLGFSTPGVLSSHLNSAAQQAKTDKTDVFGADQALVKLFASAAVEMWHRAIHSFIVSAGLYSTSKLWSAVAGYYASHYAVRGHAHLLGRFILYRHKKVIVLNLDKGKFSCHIHSKNGSDREHKAYWNFVRYSTLFGRDPFFDVNPDAMPRSDGAHRNKANYVDHLNDFSRFDALTLQQVVERVQRISDLELNSIPIPSAEKYPDLDSVQIMAYHRIISFRRYLGDLLGDESRFWRAHRTPHWSQNIVDFQIVAPQFLMTAAIS